MAIHNIIRASEFEPLTNERQQPRQRTVFVIGKVTRGDREYVCRVRNISNGGAAIEHDAGLSVGDDVTIELRGLSRSRATVRWIDGTKAGLAFVEQVQLQQDSREENGHVPRSPRFAAARRVTLRTDTAPIEISLCDIALGGMKVAAGGLKVGSPATIILHGHETVMTGWICWTSATASGVQFTCPITTQDLIAILREGADDAPSS